MAHDGTHTGTAAAHGGHPDDRVRPASDTRVRRRRRMWVTVLAAKVVVVGVLLLVPAGLAISLGAAHLAAVVLMLAGVAVAAVLLRRRVPALRRFLPHGPHHHDEVDTAGHP